MYIANIKKKLFSSGKKYRKFYLLVGDLFLIAFSTALFVISKTASDRLLYNFVIAFFPLAFIMTNVFNVFKLYHSLWHYAEADEFFNCLIAIAICTVLSTPYLYYVADYGPASSFMLPLCIGTVLMGFRISYRYVRSMGTKKTDKAKKRLLIVGAGAAGSALLSELTTNINSEYKPIGLIDDDVSKLGMYIKKVKIIGTSKNIPDICNEYNIDTIMIAINHITSESQQRIIGYCKETSCDIKVLSPMLGSKDPLSKFQSLKIEDLLSREPVVFTDNALCNLINDQTILVTGAGGSIGSELCRQIAKLSPKLLIMLDINENSIYELEQEFKMLENPFSNFTAQIASIKDINKLDFIFDIYKPDIVFHAAAHKHVPLMEINPEEAVKNNVFGTLNVVKMAKKHKVKKFILISTDKAVNPTSIMGATKNIAEMIISCYGQTSETVFSAVRFGNVLGSNGSVVPLFKKQIEKGGPVTITHPDIIRYFMTIGEAVQLVFRAASMAKGGEIFVLDMGKPVKIMALAEQMIRLSGYVPHKDIKIQSVGLRPGEKLFEELLISEEGLGKTDDQRIFIGHHKQFNLDELSYSLDELYKVALANDQYAIIDNIKNLVPSYHQDTAPCAKLAIDYSPDKEAINLM